MSTLGAARSGFLAFLVILVGAWVADVQAVEEIRVAHILLQSKTEAETVRKEITAAGGDAKAFREACWKYSKDPGTKPLGGDLSWISRTSRQYDPTFHAAAFRLKDNEISEPVKTQFGWHLIRVSERRDQGRGATKGATVDTSDPLKTAKNLLENRDNERAGKTSVGPGEIGPPTPPETTALAEVKRRQRTGDKMTLSIESTTSVTQQRQFDPTFAVELRLTLRNDGTNEQKVPVPALLPMGFSVTRINDGAVMPADFTGLAEPASFFTTLGEYEIKGLVVSLNDYFKTLSPNARYELTWKASTLFSELEARFPQVKDLPDYDPIKTKMSPSHIIRVDNILRDKARRLAFPRDFKFSLYERVNRDQKYYVKIKLSREEVPLVFELVSSSKQFRAVNHFMNLALEGYYDGLNFYDINAGDYAVGGCPLRRGTGAPAQTMRGVTNLDGISHKRGTVSFVTRPVRTKAPVRGGEVGSIFFVCLKDHPEWDDEHVPFGTVVSGLDVFDRITPSNSFESVIIMTEAEYKGETPAATATGTGPQIVRGNSEAMIKTAKGELRVTLYEDVAPNTVANFISLAEKGFYDKTADGKGKQTFYFVREDAQGKSLIVTGSPTNDALGDPGYPIPDEVNPRKCERGALVMMKAWDDEKGSFVPDTAGSQFFVCLRDIEAFDFEQLTVFGKVIGGLDVLDKLEKGDTLEEVKITKKRNRPYDRFRRATR